MSVLAYEQKDFIAPTGKRLRANETSKKHPTLKTQTCITIKTWNLQDSIS